MTKLKKIMLLVKIDVITHGKNWLFFGLALTIALTALLMVLDVSFLRYDLRDWSQPIRDTYSRVVSLLILAMPVYMAASAFSDAWNADREVRFYTLPVSPAAKVIALFISRVVYGCLLSLVFLCVFEIKDYSLTAIAGVLTNSFKYLISWQILFGSLYLFGSIYLRRFGSVVMTVLIIVFVTALYMMSMLSINMDIMMNYMIPNFSSSYDGSMLAQTCGVYGVPYWLYSGIMNLYFHVILPVWLLYLTVQRLKATER